MSTFCIYSVYDSYTLNLLSCYSYSYLFLPLLILKWAMPEGVAYMLLSGLF